MRPILNIIILLSLSLSLTLHAQDNQEKLTDFEYTKQIKKQIEEISGIQPEDFRREIDNYRKDIQVYFEHKKRVCRGEFSTVILGEPENSEEETEKNSEGEEKKPNRARKLNRQERQLCFREMKALQVTFINQMFEARKRYLNFLHEKRLKELDEARKKAIKDLKASFSSP